MSFSIVAAPVMSFACAAILTGWLVRHRVLLDRPNARSLHRVPTPRTGGIAIAVAVVSAVALAFGLHVFIDVVAVSLAFVFAVSLVDDARGLSPWVRLVVQIGAAVTVVADGLALERLTLPGVALPIPAGVSAFFCVLFIVWMTNLYNFMDGMDGFAGGMAIIGFGCFGLLGLIQHAPYFSVVCFVLTSAAAGFVLYNFPPAKIFMGDTGSSLLGFSAAALSLWADTVGIFPLWVAVLVFSPFIVDATATLLTRAVRAERFWRAHKSHYYQRLVEFGWGHRKTVLGEYVLMVACAVSALTVFALDVRMQWLMIVGWLMVYAGLMVWVKQLQRRVSKHEHHSTA